MYIGIDIGGTKIAYGLFDENKKMVRQYRVRTDPALKVKEFFDNLIEELEKFLKNCQIPLQHIKGIGIGIPSFLDYDKGFIIKTGSIPELHDFPVRDYLQSKLPESMTIRIDNDGNTAALAEMVYGAGREYAHLVYSLISTGIGSSYIIDRKLFRGSYGWAGETGHMIAEPSVIEPVLCGCGHSGCFNSYASGKMIMEHVKKWLKDDHKSILYEMAKSPETLTLEMVFQAAQQGDSLAVKAVTQMSHYLTIWFFNIYQALNINCFIIGGGLIKAQKKLLEKIEEEFHSLCDDTKYPVYFKYSELDNDAGVYGAMELLFEEEK